MKWFYDLKTIKKMHVLISIVVISLLVIGGAGLFFTIKANQANESMYNDRLLPVRWLNIMRAEANAINFHLFELTNTTNKQEMISIVNDIKEKRKIINSYKDKYKETFLLDYEKEHIEAYENISSDIRQIHNNIIELATTGQKTKALSVLRNSDDKLNEYQQELSNLAGFNADQAEKMYKQGQTDSMIAIFMIIFISILSIAACASLGLVAANRIAGTMGIFGEKLKAMSKGDLTIEKIGRPDNSCIGDICVIFDETLESIRTLVSEVVTCSQQIAAGTEEMSRAANQTTQGSQQVATSVTQLAAGAQQIAQNITDLSLGAQSISKNVNDGSDNVSKMNLAIQKISNEANNVASLAKVAQENANDGQEYTQKAVDKIVNIKQVSSEISKTISELGHLSSEIVLIVDLIKNIAGQTNLLALNAAIEAARAGEHGKGFAVVAEEVKKLATESASATDKITEMIKQIQNKTNEAVKVMDEGVNQVDQGVDIVGDAGKALNKIIDVIKETSNNINSVTKEISMVAENSSDVVKMINNISTVTDETANAASDISSVTEETAASAEEISAITQQQCASLEEINANINMLVDITQTLNKQVAVFKI